MKRTLGSALVAFLVLGSVLTVAGTASGANVAIQSANASVSQPAPGETFTLSADIANLQSSSGPVEVTDVYVRKSGSGKDIARIEDIGTVAAGGSLSVPLSMSFDDAGERRLVVSAVVRDSNGDYQTVNYPLYVDVEEPDEASLSFADVDTVAGQESGVNVTVSNGDSNAISNVRVELSGDASVENAERVTASLQSGTQTTYAYDVTFAETGQQTLQATLTYKTSEGSTRTIERTVTVDVDEANVDPELTAAGKEVNGSAVVQTSLTEYGNVELRDVQIRAVVDGETVARTVMPDVGEEETRTVTLDGSDIPAGSVTIEAQYTAAGEQRTTSRTIEYSPQETSNMTLTGVEVTQTGSSVTLSGDVANLGSADASSVLLTVVDGDGVSADSSGGEYFVGTVETSEFATFELTATTSAGPNASVESVPVRISYSADGERVEQVVDVDLGSSSDAAAMASGESDGSGSGGRAAGPGGAAGGPPGSSGSDGLFGGLPLTTIGIVLVAAVIGVAGFAVYRWRQQ